MKLRRVLHFLLRQLPFPWYTSPVLIAARLFPANTQSLPYLVGLGFFRLLKITSMCQIWARSLRLMCPPTCQTYLALLQTSCTALTWALALHPLPPAVLFQSCPLSTPSQWSLCNQVFAIPDPRTL